MAASYGFLERQMIRSGLHLKKNNPATALAADHTATLL